MEATEIRSILETGKLVNVTFTKKDGSKRVLLGRSGVKKGVNGVGMAYDKHEKGIVIMSDFSLLQKGVPAEKACRAIRMDSIVSIKAAGEQFIL